MISAAFLIFLCQAHADGNVPPVEQPNEPASKGLSVHLIYTGNTKGVSGAKNPMTTIGALRSMEDESLRVEVVNFYHNALVQGPWVLQVEDHRMKSLQSFLDGSEVDCSAPIEVQVLQSDSDRLLLLQERPSSSFDTIELANPGLEKMQGVAQRSCRNALGKHAVLVGPNVPEQLPSWEISSYEVGTILALEVSYMQTTAMMFLQGLPTQEVSRTVAAIKGHQTQFPDSLYIDAGNFVDGGGGMSDQSLSPFRPILYQQQQELGSMALVPGEMELLGGAELFFTEVQGKGLPYIATNWKSDNPDLDFPTHLQVSAETPGGPVELAFVGIIDPKLHERIPELAQEGIEILDPVEETQRIVDRLYRSANPPDVVISLTTANAEELQKLRRRLHGVDLMIGDSSYATLRIAQRKVTFRDFSSAVKGAPLTLAMDGPASIHLVLDPETRGLRTVTNAPFQLNAGSPIDEPLTASITNMQLVDSELYDLLLLSPGGNGLSQVFGQEEWESLICEAVRQQLDADTVLLHRLPPIHRVPGPLSAHQVAEQLSVLDQMEVHWVPGTQLQRFLDQSYGNVSVSCGAKPGTSSAKTGGRSIEGDRVYRMVTTDRTRRSSVLELLLQNTGSSMPLDKQAEIPIRDGYGRPLTLNKVVMDELMDNPSRRSASESTHYYLTEAPSEMPPQWILRSRKMSLTVESFQQMENTVFAEVPETMASSLSSRTLGGDGDLALDYSNEQVWTDLRFRGTFSQLETEEGEQENEDDFRISTAFSSTESLLSLLGVRLSPYEEVLFDSEFTPTETELGERNPRQSDLSLTAGFVTQPWRSLGPVRFGILINRDLAQLEEKPTEYGGKIQWDTGKTLFSHVKWSTTGDLQIYGGSTEAADNSDLRMRLYSETSFAFPLSRLLALSVYGKGLGLQGRGPDTIGEFGYSWNLGCAFNLHGAFEL
jgi:hypothetical protein